MEVYYVILRVFHTFGVIELPVGEAVESVGSERQALSLVLSSVNGCRVKVRRDENLV